MAGYNLGGYSNSLNIDGLTDDDINGALANSGSDYQLQAPQMGTSAQPAMAEMSQPAAQAAEQVAAPSPTEQWKAPEQEQKSNMLSKVLGIVGGLVGGGAGAILGGVGQASKK
jgi:hypothetical protein